MLRIIRLAPAYSAGFAATVHAADAAETGGLIYPWWLAGTMGALALTAFGLAFAALWRLRQERVRHSKQLLELESAREHIAMGIAHVEDSSRMLKLLDATATFEEAIVIAAGFCNNVLPCRAGALYLFDAERQIMVRRASWGDESASPVVLEHEDCWALRCGAVHRTQPGITPACRHLSSGGRERSACLPLISRNEMIGLITAEVVPPRAHEDIHRDLVDTLVDWMALALRSVRSVKTCSGKVSSIR